MFFFNKENEHVLRLVREERLDNGLTMTTLELARSTTTTGAPRFRQSAAAPETPHSEFALIGANPNEQLEPERWDGGLT